MIRFPHTANRLSMLLACSLLASLATPALAGQTLTGRWWVVLGASPAPGAIHQDFTAARQAADAAERCGVETMGDFSVKFEGFAPDLYVSVAGGYRTRQEAAAILAKVRSCVPGAYLKQGSYAGE